MAIGTTAAVLGAAAIGTAGSLASGAMQANAAEKAADSQVQAARESAQLQKDAAIQARIDAYPWALQGAQALYMYMDEIGIPRPQNPILPDLARGPFAESQASTATPSQPVAPAPAVAQAQASAPQYSTNRLNWGEAVNGGANALATSVPAQVSPAAVAPNAIGSVNNLAFTEKKGFQETPGYAFQLEQGNKAVLNNLSALGMKNSGLAMKELTRFGQGLANQEYGNWLNRLATTAGLGQQQTNTTNALLANTASNVGQTIQNAGDARASGYIGAGNAWANAFSGASNNIGNALGFLAYNNKVA